MESAVRLSSLCSHAPDTDAAPSAGDAPPESASADSNAAGRARLKACGWTCSPYEGSTAAGEPAASRSGGAGIGSENDGNGADIATA